MPKEVRERITDLAKSGFDLKGISEYLGYTIPQSEHTWSPKDVENVLTRLRCLSSCQSLELHEALLALAAQDGNFVHEMLRDSKNRMSACFWLTGLQVQRLSAYHDVLVVDTTHG